MLTPSPWGVILTLSSGLLQIIVKSPCHFCAFLIDRDDSSFPWTTPFLRRLVWSLILIFCYDSLSVVGAFISPTNVLVKVNLGDPFTFDCPPREHSYGVVYSWGNADGTGHYTFARNDRRSISSNGTLFITYLTQNDIDEIDSYKGIKCIISGANSFQRSGTLRLEKIDKNQTGKEKGQLFHL